MKKNDIELLSPVGSFESLMSAIQAGADAVYFGVGKLNMRSRSTLNFSQLDMEKIHEICTAHNIKTYLTLNVVLYDHELEQTIQLIEQAKSIGIHAIIATDHAAIQYARQKKLEVHISTQTNISNIESLKFYSNYADVMVLARELNLNQTKKIYDQINNQNILGPGGKKIRIELFIHGALCMSISGKCYLSLHESGFSANRGECLQICRRKYHVKEEETGKELEIDNEYIMSPKDLCTIHFIDKIIGSGVQVFKIEGRARSPEYVYTVTKCYREAINSVLDGTYNRNKTLEWERILKTVFNRGFWDGYYLGQTIGEWNNAYGSKSTLKKIYVAKGLNYFSKLGIAEFLCEADVLSIGDKVLIIGPTTGLIELIIEEIRVDLKQVKTVIQGQRFSIPVNKIVRRSDKLFKLVSV